MNDKIELKIPSDLVEFLSHGKRLEYPIELCEAGEVHLLPLDQLVVEEVVFDRHSVDDIEPDPNEDTPGEYSGMVIGLVEECENYDGENLLAWYPEIGCYGSYNSETGMGLYFPGKSWTDIASDPLPYLNAPWLGEDEMEICAPILPWRHFSFEED